MDNIILNIIKHSSGFIDNIIIFYFLTQFFHFKDKIKYKYLYSFALLILSYSILYLIPYYPTLNTLLTLVVLIVFYIYSLYFLKGGYWIKAFVLFGIYAIFYLFSAIFYNVSLFFVHDISGPKHDIYMSAIYMMRTFSSLIIIELFLILAKKKKLLFKRDEKLLLISFSIFFSMVSIYITYIMDTNANASYLLFILCSMIATILIYSVLGNSARKNDKLMEMEMVSLVNKNLKDQIETTVKQQNEIRKLKHDMKNHFIIVRKLACDGAYAELCSYMDQMFPASAMDGSVDKICENIYINAILADKRDLCKEKNIRFIYSLVCDTTQLNSYQSSVVLFNLIDNAIEACENISLDNKTVYLKMMENNSYVDVKIINPIIESVLDNEFKTTKENKSEHGIGHLIVKETLDENGGMIEYYEENNEFIAHALMKKEK